MALEQFKVSSRLKEGLSVENTSGKFTVLMDESETLRGTDTGMNPIDMLLCTLGSCQCIVARMFARAQKIDLEEFWVELEGDLDPAGFLKGTDGIRPGFQEVRYTMHMKTNTSREKAEAFAAFIKSRCPVSDMLLNGVSVVQQDVIIEP